MGAAMKPRTKALSTIAAASVALTAGFFALSPSEPEPGFNALAVGTYELDVTLTPGTLDPPGIINCEMDWTGLGTGGVPAKSSCTTRHPTLDEWESCSSTSPVGYVFTCPLKFGAGVSDGTWTINHVSAFEDDGTTRMIAYRDELVADSQAVDFTIDSGACVPQTCVAQGLECGVATDGCGTPLDCDVETGGCTGFETCGVDAPPNICGCLEDTCIGLGLDCGTPPDGCGGTLPSCGTCTGFDTCGGAGTPYVCGCTPDTCISTGYECGTGHADGCGGAPFDCGTAGACDLGFTCSDAPNFTCVPDGVDPTGLLAQYDFDSDGCPSSVIDSSGNGFTGTCSTPAPVWTASGHNGGGYDLSQSEIDYITLGDIDAQQPVTVSLWFKAIGTQSAWDPLVSKGNAANYILESSGDGLSLGFFVNTAAWGWVDFPGSAAAYTDGLWHHAAGVYDGATNRAYLDCNPASVGLAGDLTLTDTLTTIGANPDTPGTQNWGGIIDEVRIYARALSQTEINILSEQPSCGAGGSGGTGGTGGTGGVGGAPPTELLSVDMTGAPAGASWTLSRAGVGDVATGTTDLTPTAYVYGDYTLTWEDTAFAWVPPAPENCTVSESNPCDFGPP